MGLNRELRRIDWESQDREFSEEEEQVVFVHDADMRRELIRDAVTRKRRIDDADPATLPYADFLESEYWKILSQRLKAQAGYRCQLCGWTGPTGIEVHHKTYAHRGREIAYLEDLIVLCRACHKKQHLPKPPSGTTDDGSR